MEKKLKHYPQIFKIVIVNVKSLSQPFKYPQSPFFFSCIHEQTSNSIFKTATVLFLYKLANPSNTSSRSIKVIICWLTIFIDYFTNET